MTIPIRSITLRLVAHTQHRKGRYTTGETDPDMVSIIAAVRSGDAVGYGECIPTSVIYEPGHQGRSGIDEWQVIQQTAGGMIGADARRLRGLIPPELETEDANSIVDALDFALHDLVGKVAGLPAWALIGPSKRDCITGMPVIHNDTPEGMAASAGYMYDRGGYTWYKLKPHGNAATDLEAMRQIRAGTTPDAMFYADPNRALDMDPGGVVDYINALHAGGLAVIEDPIDTDWAGYRAIQQRTAVHVMIDVKARTAQNVLAIAAEKCARFVNIHANWAGGFAGGVRKAHIAHAADIGVIIGSAGFLGIGNAAYQTLASVLPSPQPCEQVNCRADVRDSIVTHPYKTENGNIHIPDAPGLGIDIDLGKLETATQDMVVLD